LRRQQRARRGDGFTKEPPDDGGNAT